MNQFLSVFICAPSVAFILSGNRITLLEMIVQIRIAQPDEASVVSAILSEAATWLLNRGTPLWQHSDITVEAVQADVRAGLYYLAWADDEPAGVMRFQLSDPEFWPDSTAEEANYIHRLAVSRRYAGGKISSELLGWAVNQTRNNHRRWLRLDCAADRPALRGVYERFGFRFHSEKNMGRFTVARYQFDVRSELAP